MAKCVKAHLDVDVGDADRKWWGGPKPCSVLEKSQFSGY